MRNELEKFNETVSILVKAYLNGTLTHGSCTACAVGNIVAEKNGYKINGTYWVSNGVERTTEWNNVFCTPRGKKETKLSPSFYHGSIKSEIDSTGYTWHELSRIENAFECCAQYDLNDSTQIGDEEEQMFNGLMAVLDVLAEIHEIDLEQKEESKKLFVKA